MTTCSHVTASDTCAHYNIVAKSSSSSSTSNPYYKKVPRSNQELMQKGMNMLSGNCTLGINC